MIDSLFGSRKVFKGTLREAERDEGSIGPGTSVGRDSCPLQTDRGPGPGEADCAHTGGPDLGHLTQTHCISGQGIIHAARRTKAALPLPASFLSTPTITVIVAVAAVVPVMVSNTEEAGGVPWWHCGRRPRTGQYSVVDSHALVTRRGSGATCPTSSQQPHPPGLLLLLSLHSLFL